MSGKRWALVGSLLLTAVAVAQPPDPSVLEAERQRVAVIEKARPATVAVFQPQFQGGGSGVLIDADGFALTNYHVIDGPTHHYKCGLPDGHLYDAVVVGIDKIGDLALIKLIPTTEGQKFPFAPLGDSDAVREGDWCFAAGNPHLLATDFQPTVTFGLVSGTHRYQPPAARGRGEYTDCIQVDTAINPGNSGGPLFNMKGEVIGINGRIQFEKRVRINVGVGFAISSNQIKNFLGHLYVGLDTDHATLGASFATAEQDDDLSRMVVKQVLEEADAARRGLQVGDEMVSFAGRRMNSVNEYKNVLGIFPKEWRLPMVYRRNDVKSEVLVRLMPLQDSLLADNAQPKPPPGMPPGMMPMGPPPPPPPPGLPYKEKPGFANYHFNEVAQQRLMTALRQTGDFGALSVANWSVDAEALVQDDQTPTPAVLHLGPPKDGPTDATVVRLRLKGLDYTLDPLKPGQDVKDLQMPFGSGGLMMALYHYRRLLTLGPKGFETGFWHGGREPIYIWPADGSRPAKFQDIRVDAEVLRTEHAGVPGRWYFSPKNQTLLGFEITVDPSQDPCEVLLGDYRVVEGRKLPHRIEVRQGDGRYAVFTVKKFALSGP